MADPRYTYDKINAIKVILVNDRKEVLLIQEPETNEWMPLRWGLPGGKPVITESLQGACERKLEEEIGQITPIDGLFRIEELLQNDRTVLMFILVSTTKGRIKPQGESKIYKWASLEEIKKMAVNDFTEFFNKQLLLDYLSKEHKLTSLSIVETMPYYKLKNDQKYQSWLQSGSKK